MSGPRRGGGGCCGCGGGWDGAVCSVSLFLSVLPGTWREGERV